MIFLYFYKIFNCKRLRKMHDFFSDSMQCDAQIQHLLETVWHQNYHGFSDYIRDNSGGGGGLDINKQLSLSSGGYYPAGRPSQKQLTAAAAQSTSAQWGKVPSKFAALSSAGGGKSAAAPPGGSQVAVGFPRLLPMTGPPQQPSRPGMPPPFPRSFGK